MLKRCGLSLVMVTLTLLLLGNRWLRDCTTRFESMQTWQSEFLAVLSVVLLTAFLRQKSAPSPNRCSPRTRIPATEPPAGIGQPVLVS